MSFKNKTVIVTGAGSGVGEATAILFAKNEADVVIIDINEDTANITAEKIKKLGCKVLVIRGDVSKDVDMNTAIEKVIKEFGKIDVLVNNAGIVRSGNLMSGNIMQTCDEVMNTNLRSVLLLTSLAAPYLLKTKGCVVNVSSVLSTVTKKDFHFPVYAVTKAGINCFTRESALELAPSGVRVNSVNLGPVKTNLIENSKLNTTYDEYSAHTALNKCSEPEEIAELILFLASDKAKSITGSIYNIDNGVSLM